MNKVKESALAVISIGALVMWVMMCYNAVTFKRNTYMKHEWTLIGRFNGGYGYYTAEATTYSKAIEKIKAANKDKAFTEFELPKTRPRLNSAPAKVNKHVYH